MVEFTQENEPTNKKCCLNSKYHEAYLSLGA